MMHSFFSVAWRPLLCLLFLGLLPASLALASSLDNIGQEASQYFAGRAAPTALPDPWLSKALDLQNKADYREPLATSTFLMTHNSYNSAAYRTAFAYIDPNHRLSLGQQLDAGVRSLELDVHKFFSMTGWPWQWRQRLLLCHGQDSHLGCSPYDRPLEAGVDEIRRWLDDARNAKEVIVIYIEDHTDARYADLVSILSQRMGNKVYRPQGAGCQGIPMHISKQDILNSGKQVLLMGGSEVCSAGSGWSTWAYAGVGDRLSGYPTGEVEDVDGVHCDFDREFFDRYWVRFYEDRTLLSSVFAHPDRIDVEDAANLQKCGANLIGFDKLAVADERLYASVWSWDVGQPSDQGGNENCAVSAENNRFDDRACTEVARYACRKPGTHEWYVSEGTGIWELGSATCDAETLGEFVFAVPTNGYDNEQLNSVKLAQGANAVWLNLDDQTTEGQWEASSR